MKKPKKAYFRIPIIGNEHYIYVCVDTRKNGLKKLQNYFKGKDDKFTISEFEARGKSFLADDLHPFMWVDIERKQILATTAHEALHCIMSVLKYSDVDIRDSEELAAIMLSSVVRAVEQECF